MSRIRADKLVNRAATGAPQLTYGAELPVGYGLTGAGNINISGVATATTLSATTLSATTLSVSGNATVTGNATITGNTVVYGNLQIEGTQTVLNTEVLDVEDKNIGIASTATKFSNSELHGAGITIYGSEGDKTLTWDNVNSRMAFSTDLYAPRYYGDGSNLTGVVVGILTEAASPSNATVTLDLSNAQDHKITATGITTITVSGGTEGESHTVRIVNSGSSTVGFSTYFLFPSGAAPSLPTADGAISLISFTVHRVGAAGTQLLAGASVNFS